MQGVVAKGEIFAARYWGAERVDVPMGPPSDGSKRKRRQGEAAPGSGEGSGWRERGCASHMPILN